MRAIIARMRARSYLVAVRATRVVLEPKARQAIERHAGELWPREMVGLLAGAGGGDGTTVTGFVQLPNVAIEGDRFAVEPAAFAGAIADLERTGRTFLGFVHSHPGGGPGLSAVDRQQLWRGCLQLVVSIDADGEADFACFGIDGDGAHRLALVTTA